MSVSSNKKRKQSDNNLDEEPTVGKQRIKELEKELTDIKMELLDTKTELLDIKKKLMEAEERATKAEAKAGSGDEEDEVSDDEESVEGDANDPWNIKFKELREYRIINENCNVPQKGSHQKLGEWVKNQRQAYGRVKLGKKGNKITQERINMLDGLGMIWGKAYPAPASWEESFEELQKYQKAMGHCNIHISPTDPSPLAKFVSVQRSEYKRFKKGRDSLLTLEQIGQLKEIGFKWKGPR